MNERSDAREPALPPMTRRRFHHLGVVLVPLAYACAAVAGILRYLAPVPAGRRKKSLDAGPASDYAPAEPPRRFVFNESIVYVLHDGERIRALNAKCTHLACNIVWPSENEKDYEDYKGSFKCRCHGARFDREGNATRGPATAPLREFVIADIAQAKGRVIILDEQKERTG